MSEIVEKTIVACGMRIGGKNKKLSSFMELVDGDPSGDERLYSFISCVVGGIYTINSSADFREINPSSIAFTGETFHNDKTIAVWKVKHEQSKVAISMRTTENKIKSKHHDEFREALEPWRRQWKKSNRAGRVALEAIVLAYLRDSHRI